MSRDPKKTIRNKADRLLQDYIRDKYKDVLCYLCGERPVQVGHHFVYKSQSNALRYYIPNIIPLCTKCHCDIHVHPSLHNAKITLLMGPEWVKDLEEKRIDGIKANLDWYQSCYNAILDLFEKKDVGL